MWVALFLLYVFKLLHDLKGAQQHLMRDQQVNHQSSSIFPLIHITHLRFLKVFSSFQGACSFSLILFSLKIKRLQALLQWISHQKEHFHYQYCIAIGNKTDNNYVENQGFTLSHLQGGVFKNLPIFGCFLRFPCFHSLITFFSPSLHSSGSIAPQTSCQHFVCTSPPRVIPLEGQSCEK